MGLFDTKEKQKKPQEEEEEDDEEEEEEKEPEEKELFFIGKNYAYIDLNAISNNVDNTDTDYSDNDKVDRMLQLISKLYEQGYRQEDWDSEIESMGIENKYIIFTKNEMEES